MKDKKVYGIPGEKISSLESFYTIIGEVINGPGGYFGDNLDAFIDCLRGGFGTPATFTLKWNNSELSKKALGYEETVSQLQKRLKSCHPSNKSDIQKKIKRAKLHKGPTVFDWLVQIIEEAENVDLILD